MMYSVLIVEDESLELQALTKLVKSHTDRIKSIYQASDSVEALSLARAHMPDILLLDIHIPGQTGIEVLETLRCEGFTGIAVMITAYSQFKYAKAALCADAMDYLLKPIDRDELRTCLEKAFEKLDNAANKQHLITHLQQRMESITSFLQPIAINSLFEGTTKSSMMPMLFDWPTEDALWACALRCSFTQQLDEDEQKCVYFDFSSILPPSVSYIASVNTQETLFALYAKEKMDVAQFEVLLFCICSRILQCSRMRSCPCTVSGSNVIHHYDQFNQSFRLQQSSNKLLALPLNTVVSQSQFTSRDMRMRRSKALSYCNAGMPKRMLSTYKSLLQNSETQWAGIYCVLHTLLESDENMNLISIYQAITQSDETPSAALSTWFDTAFHLSPAHADTQNKGFIIEQTLDILNHGYADPMLSQADIAERFGLSQAYFSRLFKKETGETFITYLTHLRLERAKNLLIAGKSVSEVAESCGYQSKKYFLDVFRQNTGKTVAQYLEEVNPS